jgi:hypothetical protein
MASAAILKAVKLLRNYCQITVRLPLDYSAIIWRSQELRSGKVRRWASPPSNIPFVAVGRDGACGHRGPTGGENESVDRLSYENVEGQGIARGGCPHARPQPARFLPERPARAGSWAVGLAGLRCLGRRRAASAPRIAAPGILSAITKTRGACTVRCRSPAEPPAIGTADGPGTAGGGASYGSPAAWPPDPALSTPGENGCYRARRAASLRTNEEHRVTILGS